MVYKTLTLMVIIIGFMGLFVSQAMSFSSATVPVDANVAITPANHALISVNAPLNVKYKNAASGQMKLSVTNNMKDPVSIQSEDVHPIAGNSRFHVVVTPTDLAANQSGNVQVTVVADATAPKEKQITIPLNVFWNDGSAHLSFNLNFENQISSGKCKGNQKGAQSGGNCSSNGHGHTIGKGSAKEGRTKAEKKQNVRVTAPYQEVNP